MPPYIHYLPPSNSAEAMLQFHTSHKTNFIKVQ